MCTSALALDGVYDGERCMSLDTWHGYACVDNIGPHVQVRTCEAALVNKCGHTCGKSLVDIFVSAVALHVWEYTMLDGTTRSFPSFPGHP